MAKDQPDRGSNSELDARRKWIAAYRDWLSEALQRGDEELQGIPHLPLDRGAIEALEKAVVELRERLAAPSAQCPLLDGDADLTRILTTPGERKAGVRAIRDFTRGARRLIVADPYLLAGEAATASDYIGELSKSARLDGGLQGLTVIYSSRCGVTKAIQTGLKRAAEANQVKLVLHDNDTIHDRIWIADRKRALVVGTSLGGLGTRAAFLLDLPDADLDTLLEYLDKNGLSRG